MEKIMIFQNVIEAVDEEYDYHHTTDILATESAWDFFMEASNTGKESFIDKLIKGISSLIQGFFDMISGIFGGKGSAKRAKDALNKNPDLANSRCQYDDYGKYDEFYAKSMNAVNNAKNMGDLEDAKKKMSMWQKLLIGGGIAAVVGIAGTAVKKAHDRSAEQKKDAAKFKEKCMETSDELSALLKENKVEGNSATFTQPGKGTVHMRGSKEFNRMEKEELDKYGKSDAMKKADEVAQRAVAGVYHGMEKTKGAAKNVANTYATAGKRKASEALQAGKELAQGYGAMAMDKVDEVKDSVKSSVKSASSSAKDAGKSSGILQSAGKALGKLKKSYNDTKEKNKEWEEKQKAKKDKATTESTEDVEFMEAASAKADRIAFLKEKLRLQTKILSEKVKKNEEEMRKWDKICNDIANKTDALMKSNADAMRQMENIQKAGIARVNRR